MIMGAEGLRETSEVAVMNNNYLVQKLLGATPVSPHRATEALQEITHAMDQIELITCPFEMGEEEAKNCGFTPTVIGSIAKGRTTATDTINAAREMLNQNVHLVLFAGGDGTARDVCESIDKKVPALGIPADVKIHFAVFAVNLRKAGELTVRFLQGEASLREAEVMDVDEQAFRGGRLSAKLYG
jgi:predicted polyphosphate/ATP-dependent NAD kinase